MKCYGREYLNNLKESGMEKTIFSKIIDREIPGYIVWEDEDACAFLDIKPITPGHTLIVPTNPSPSYIFDMDSDAYHDLWQKVRWLSAQIKSALGCKRIGVMVEGFLVPHVHIHLVPIDNGNQLEPAAATRMDAAELAGYQNRIVQQISTGI
jgi:histidine triad (HIT) family protein